MIGILKNEATNKSVATYAPNYKTDSGTTSLDVRVIIAGSVQVIGYCQLWTQVFSELGLEIDGNMRTLLEKDREKA